MSDFKSNEYAHLLGGEAYEPQEENPMLGFRGACRYHRPLPSRFAPEEFNSLLDFSQRVLQKELRAGVRGHPEGARGDGSAQRASDATVRAHGGGGAALHRPDGDQRPRAGQNRPQGAPDVRDPSQRVAGQRLSRGASLIATG
eukprot:1051512-Prorocentrum_minimum.AAC.1